MNDYKSSCKSEKTYQFVNCSTGETWTGPEPESFPCNATVETSPPQAQLVKVGDVWRMVPLSAKQHTGNGSRGLKK